MGSASEFEYQLLLSRDLSLLRADRHEELDHAVTEVKKMLSALISNLRRSRKD